MGENDKNNEYGNGQKLKRFLGKHNKLNEVVKVGTAALVAGLVAWGTYTSTDKFFNGDNGDDVKKNFTPGSDKGIECAPLVIYNDNNNAAVIKLNIGKQVLTLNYGKSFLGYNNTENHLVILNNVDISLHKAQECDVDGCKTPIYKIEISSKDAKGVSIGATLREGETYFLCKTPQGPYEILPKKDFEEEFCSINDEVVHVKFNNLCKDCYGGQPGVTAEIGDKPYRIFAGEDNKYGKSTTASVKGKDGEEVLLKIRAKHYDGENYRVDIVNQQGDILYNGIVQDNQTVEIFPLSDEECTKRANEIIKMFEKQGLEETNGSSNM